MNGAVTLELGWLPLMTVRLGMSLLLLHGWFRPHYTFRGQPHPKGIARLVHLPSLMQPPRHGILTWVVRVSLVAYVAGLALPLVAGVLSFYTLVVGSLWSSQGASGHGLQPFALVLLVQAIALVTAAADPGMWWPGASSPETLVAQRVALSWCQQAFVAVYFTSGLTKLGLRPLRWISRTVWLPLSTVKAIEQEYQYNCDEPLRARRLARADVMIRHRALVSLGATAGLALEVLSPLFLFAPAGLLAGGVALFLFHYVNRLTMGLKFPQLQVLCVVLLANPFFLLGSAP